jgi:hypothetical protein
MAEILASPHLPPLVRHPVELTKALASILARAANVAIAAPWSADSAPSISREARPAVSRGGIPGVTSKPSKKFIASVLAIVAVAWPYLADIVREVVRWIHAH